MGKIERLIVVRSIDLPLGLGAEFPRLEKKLIPAGGGTDFQQMDGVTGGRVAGILRLHSYLIGCGGFCDYADMFLSYRPDFAIEHGEGNRGWVEDVYRNIDAFLFDGKFGGLACGERKPIGVVLSTRKRAVDDLTGYEQGFFYRG